MTEDILKMIEFRKSGRSLAEHMSAGKSRIRKDGNPFKVEGCTISVEEGNIEDQIEQYWDDYERAIKEVFFKLEPRLNEYLAEKHKFHLEGSINPDEVYPGGELQIIDCVLDVRVSFLCSGRYQPTAQCYLNLSVLGNPDEKSISFENPEFCLDSLEALESIEDEGEVWSVTYNGETKKYTRSVRDIDSRDEYDATYDSPPWVE